MATPQREGPGKSGQQSREQGGGRPSRGSLGARAVQARRCLPNAVVCLTPACLLRRKSTASVPIPSSRPAIATSASRRQHVLRHTRRHTSRKSSGRDWSETVGDAQSAYRTAPQAFPYVKKQRTTPMTAERAQPRGSENREFPPC